jgi:hypothetical protein
MADVTINELTKGTPTGDNILPYSTGSNTLGVSVSALFQNTSNVYFNSSNDNVSRFSDNLVTGTTSASFIIADNANKSSAGPILSSSNPPLLELRGTTFNFSQPQINFTEKGNVMGSIIVKNYGGNTGAFHFCTNNTNFAANSAVSRMTISSNGSVGVGTTAPAEKLTVVGNISATGDVISPSVPKFAYAVLSQIGTAPYTVTTLASAHVQSISVNASTADITINWTTDYFNDANYCVTFGAQSQFVGNRSQGINIQTGSTKTRNSITIMAGSVSNGQFYAVPNINVMAIQ